MSGVSAVVGGFVDGPVVTGFVIAGFVRVMGVCRPRNCKQAQHGDDCCKGSTTNSLQRDELRAPVATDMFREPAGPSVAGSCRAVPSPAKLSAQ